MVYHGIVESKIRSLFDGVNRGDAKPVIDVFARIFEHRFTGDDHPLGGSRTSLDKTREWYARLYRLLPDIHFDLERIDVSGPPWNTLAVIEWRETNSATDGVRTSACGAHIVHLAWGKMTRLHITTDTAALHRTLERIFAAGTAEAHAPPITG